MRLPAAVGARQHGELRRKERKSGTTWNCRVRRRSEDFGTNISQDFNNTTGGEVDSTMFLQQIVPVWVSGYPGALVGDLVCLFFVRYSCTTSINGEGRRSNSIFAILICLLLGAVFNWESLHFWSHQVPPIDKAKRRLSMT